MSKPCPSTQLPPTQDEVPVEQSTDSDIREEREDLKEAAEQTLNVILDLSLDGVIRWVSPSWTDVIGTTPDSVRGKPIRELLASDNKDVFSHVTEKMEKNKSRSQFIRFSAYLGSCSKLVNSHYSKQVTVHGSEDSSPKNFAVVELEGQGILVSERVTDREGQLSDLGGETHSMWMIRPWIAPCRIQIDLPDIIVEFLGSGAEVLASYLTSLAESGVEDPSSILPPPPVLCRICEHQIPPWWFEKHTELCLQEHKAEMEIQISQENLLEHRHAIVKVLDALEAGKSSFISGECSNNVPLQAEDKNMAVGFISSSPSVSSSTISTVFSNGRSRESSVSGNTHSRKKSFAIRRPLARIVELLLDLCDTSIEISTPAFKESTCQVLGEFRVQSPQSEGRISQVIQWQSPSTNTLDQEQGLALLCADTEKVAKAKVEAVIRYRRILEYTERIRIEFSVMVQDCIDEAIRKAARIAAGYLTDSDEEGTETHEISTDTGYLDGSTSNLNMSRDLVQDRQKMLSLTTNSSTRSSSPKEAPVTRSQTGNFSNQSQNQDSHRYSIFFESDTGGDSDGSVRSLSLLTRTTRTDSPLSEAGDLRRAANSRQRQRRSMVLLGSTSPCRQESPVRQPQSSSPLRITKPRSLAVTHESFASPIVSPMHNASEFSSPALLPHHHHRRQSSAAGSDPCRPPQSPRLSSVGVPQARIIPPSIKDFEVIKPISKGAFGSVYLARKKSTGDYYAIKVLKKADMVAKNQVTNVKAERAIMMWQGESDFVAKLYWTFSSKDYLYLVMEYLDGGDCASLIKALGGLPEDWAKKYLGEVILGVKHLHSRGIVHRDLKPDNLLIDQKGHLKLTDFGLSRMGLIGRQKRVLDSNATDSAPDLLKQGPFARTTSISSSRSTSMDLQGNRSPSSSSQTTSEYSLTTPSYFSLNRENTSKRVSRRASSRSDNGDTLLQIFSTLSMQDPDSQKSMKSQPVSCEEFSEHDSNSRDHLSHYSISGIQSHEQKNTPPATSMMPPPMALFDPDDSNRRFVGTPDYLAPETVKGLGQDEISDWWSVGCILFEFLYGYPPFHAQTPDEVFENILARRISWPEENYSDTSDEARDLVNKLLCLDPKQRLGANANDEFECGGDQIQSHPWFKDVDWEKLLEDEAQFIPAPENPEDTEYFDPRGATLQSFAEEMEDQTSPANTLTNTEYHERPHDALSRVRSHVNSIKRNMMPLHIPPHVRDMKSRRLSEPVATDDFGNFTFKNLPVLEKANKDVIQKLRAEAMAMQCKSINSGSTSCSNSAISPGSTLDISLLLPNPSQRTMSCTKGSSGRSSSPSGQSHTNTSPNKTSQPSSPLLVSFVAGPNPENRRKTSSTSICLPHNPANSMSLANSVEISRISSTLQKSVSTLSSPIKSACNAPLPFLATSSQKSVNSIQNNDVSNRTRSLTVDSQESNLSLPIEAVSIHRKRRSQVFEISPSSSDTEGDRETALLRVQRRRQSSRRMSQISMSDGPFYRPLDVLICEDHPVTRMVMEKLIEKLRCRSITVSNGAEAVRFAMSEIQFDIIMMEFKLPQINGADVARMIRDTKNSNSQTPIIALTGYLKELQAPHQFDALIEKPPTTSKLVDIMSRLCYWKPPASDVDVSGPIRNHKLTDLLLKSRSFDEGSTLGIFSSDQTSCKSLRDPSRENSIVSSMTREKDSSQSHEYIPILVNRKASNDCEKSNGLGIRHIDALSPPCVRLGSSVEPSKTNHDSTKYQQQTQRESIDDGDQRSTHVLGFERSLEKKIKTRRGSNLSTEIMRNNSQENVISRSDFVSEVEKFKFPSSQDATITPNSSCRTTRMTLSERSLQVSPVTHLDLEETPRNAPVNLNLIGEDSTPKAVLYLPDYEDYPGYGPRDKSG